MKKLNCWEEKKCGREPGGASVGVLGICPAASERSLDGVHGGKNGGRACWVIAGTFCQGAVQGTFARKYASCRECNFYQSVMRNEGSQVLPPSLLLVKLDGAMKYHGVAS